MYSLVIKIAILVIKTVLLGITKPAPGLFKPRVEVPTAEALRTRMISVITDNTFFLFKFL